MTVSTSHSVFSDSFAGSLSRALRQAGRDDRVVCFLDDLGFGPIAPPNPSTRLDWARRERFLDLPDLDWFARTIGDFWKAALSTSGRRIVWVSRRVASEYAGFLEWVWRLGDEPYELVEFTEAKVSYRGEPPRRAIGLAVLTADHLEAFHLWDHAKPLDAAARDQCRAIWAKLRREDSPLRILDETGLVSAPISTFDDLLLSCTVARWRKVARVVGEALSRIYDGTFIQTGDLVLSARVAALAQAGRLESRGDLYQPRFSEVRLPASEAPEPSGSQAYEGSSSVSQ